MQVGRKALVREATGPATAGLGLKGGTLATTGITEGGAEAAGEAGNTARDFVVSSVPLAGARRTFVQ